MAMQIAPSILSADFARLGEQVREACEAGALRIHVDVMDGHFVPNLTMGPLVVAALRPIADRYGALLDVHLMIEEPDRYLDDFAAAGADVISVHVEVCRHLHRTLAAIHGLGKLAGVAINPATPLGALEEILPDLDVVLMMTVNPGFGGQSFIKGSLDKIARLHATLRERGLAHKLIQVDGGINAATIAAAARAGAEIAVVGSALFNQRASVAENLAALHAAAQAM
jgi:ribulose-phosphate 3-epimerase